MSTISSIVYNKLNDHETRITALEGGSTGGSSSTTGTISVSNVRGLEEELQTIKTSISTLESNLTKRIEDDEADITKIENDVKALKNSSSSGGSSTGGTVAAHTHEITDINGLNTRLGSIDSSVSSLDNDVKALQSSSSGSTSNSPFKGKWISILGDDISSYRGYTMVDTFDPGDAVYPSSDVTSVDKTWWHLLLTKLGAKLCVNDSWKNRDLCSDDPENETNTNDGMGRLERKEGNIYIELDGTKTEAKEPLFPDVVIVFLGNNDYNYGKPALGTIDNDTEKILGTDFYHSCLNLFRVLCTCYPSAQIYVLDGVYSNSYGFLMPNNRGCLQTQYTEAVHEAVKRVGVHLIKTSCLGINDCNYYKYLDNNIHPNAKMMEMIANTCYNSMIADNCF